MTIRMIDQVQQRRIFATLKDISYGIGEVYPELREYIKAEFTEILRKKLGEDYWGDEYGKFSLALDKCTYVDGELFYYYLINLALKDGINLHRKPLDSPPFDLTRFFKLCIRYKVCCISGEVGGDVHHTKSIGRGFDRTKIDHSKYPRMALSREFHNECHNMGQESFEKKYGVFGVYTPYWKNEDTDFIVWDEDVKEIEVKDGTD